MYGALSPTFDVPELPTLRRVKPLPKRRRTSEPSQNDDGRQHMPAVPPGMLDASPEELIAHADALSAQMALQSYYMPVLGGMHDLFTKDLVAPSSTPIDLGGGTFGMGDFRGGQDDDEFGEGDYMEHLQQPGNTKKRKVPANMSGAHGRDSSGNSGAEDEPGERGVPTGGRTDREYDATGDRQGALSAVALLHRRGKLSKATLAGLQHKELLRTRKRQLQAVIGQLSQQGDTLALDQALSASYPFARLTLSDKPPPPLRVRLSRRRGPRLARAFRAFRASLPPNTYEPKIVVPPEADFLFVCDSLTSKRLIATKEEVAALHARFEEEFTRQAVKAAEAAKQAAAAVNGQLMKRTERSKGRRARGADGKSASLEQSLLNGKTGSGKKKKRSALANASNPHHLRNYVPSRVPNSGQVNTAQNVQNAQNLLSPPPLRFLSADIPPRRRKKNERPVTPVPSLTNPVDEWICPFCEYNLFYGDELAYQRAIRNRKKILRRRRRARERAAAAASGGSAAKASEKDVPPADDGYPTYETAAYETSGAASGKQGRWKDERDRGGPQGHVYDGGAHGGLG